MERWRDVKEFPDLFMVSDQGRVWSKRSKRLLKTNINKQGYVVISSTLGGRGGKHFTRKIHRWVAECFVDNPYEKPFVNHIDGDKSNPNYQNLEWCTAKENVNHAHSTGLITTLKGSDKPGSKIDQGTVDWIRASYIPRSKDFSAHAIARKLGISRSTVSDIIHKRKWRQDHVQIDQEDTCIR